MACDRDEFVSYVSSALNCADFQDGCHNGLQCPGSEHITKIASACTASLAMCRAAADAGANALLVHHGLIWGGIKRIDGILTERLRCLFAANINLIGLHLPLDAHETWGNNAAALQALNINARGTFAPYKGQCIGRWGDLSTGIDAASLSTKCESVFQHEVVHCPGGPKSIKKIGVITGGGHHYLTSAREAGLDALITGECSEQTWHEAAELGIHCFSCGHKATENMAIHSFSEHCAAYFNLEHLRLDEENPC